MPYKNYLWDLAHREHWDDKHDASNQSVLRSPNLFWLRDKVDALWHKTIYDFKLVKKEMRLFVLRPQCNLKIQALFQAMSIINKIRGTVASPPNKQMTF